MRSRASRKGPGPRRTRSSGNGRTGPETSVFSGSDRGHRREPAPGRERRRRAGRRGGGEEPAAGPALAHGLHATTGAGGGQATRTESPRRGVCAGRRFHDPDSTRGRAWPLRPRLARHEPHVLFRRLPRPAAHGVPLAAGHQRGPGRARTGLRHPRTPGHGDRLLRPRGSARPQGQHGHGLRHHAGRRPVHVGRHRRAPQRVQRLGVGDDALPADLDPARPRGIRAPLRPEALRGGGQARAPAPRRLARRRRRLDRDPPGRPALRLGPRARPVRKPGLTEGPTRLGPGRARGARRQRSRSSPRATASRLRTSRGSRSRPRAARSRSSCSSISPEGRRSRRGPA